MPLLADGYFFAENRTLSKSSAKIRYFCGKYKFFVDYFSAILKRDNLFLKIVNFRMVSNEEKLLKDRIRHLLSMKRMPIAKLAPTPTLEARYGRQINGEASVPFSTLQMLLLTFHDIDANWLIMGEGYMQKRENIAPKVYKQHNEVHNNSAGGDINVGPDTIVTSKTVERLEAIVAEKEARIKELEQDKAFLQQLLTNAYPHLSIKK